MKFVLGLFVDPATRIRPAKPPFRSLSPAKRQGRFQRKADQSPRVQNNLQNKYVKFISKYQTYFQRFWKNMFYPLSSGNLW